MIVWIVGGVVFLIAAWETYVQMKNPMKRSYDIIYQYMERDDI